MDLLASVPHQALIETAMKIFVIGAAVLSVVWLVVRLIVEHWFYPCPKCGRRAARFDRFSTDASVVERTWCRACGANGFRNQLIDKTGWIPWQFQ